MERKTKDKTEGKKIEKANVVNIPVCQFLGYRPCHVPLGEVTAFI